MGCLCSNWASCLTRGFSELVALVLSFLHGSHADPKFAEWQHWVLVNASHTDLSVGEALTEYFGSAPGKDSGEHRYCLVIYEQPDKITADEAKVTKTRLVRCLMHK